MSFLKTLLWVFFSVTVIPILIIIYLEINTSRWDNNVKDMCDADGGVTVYETVELTQEDYNKYAGHAGVIRVPSVLSSNAEHYPFLLKSTDEIIRKSNPRIMRAEHIVYRKSDGRNLGSLVTYSRSGGDFSAIISIPSGYICFDDPSFRADVVEQIFSIKEDQE
jgi:hypothetical protein